MNRFQEKFRKYINDNRLFEPTDRILLSVSGGIDSVVLTHLFAQEYDHWAIAHANFQLRAEESEQDEAFVRQLAEKYQVPFYSHSFEAQAYAEQQQLSIQMAVREVRRAWFLEFRAQHNFDYIALAHHHNDQLETLLLNLTKGSGIAGLRAMLPKNDVWVRPLLCATKEEITVYAQEQQLTWREDRTNKTVKYQRNWIRHRVIPALQEINPSLLQTTQSTVERLREVEAIFQAEVARVRKKAVSEKDGKIFIRKKIMKEHPQAASLLTEWLSPYGFSWDEVQQIMGALQQDAQPGLQFLSATHQLWVERKALVITPQTDQAGIAAQSHEEGQVTQTTLGYMEAAIIDRKGYQIKAEASIAALDYERLQFPLELRVWQPGDAFQPLGMPHRKKVSDFLVDTKVPLYQKQDVLVLLSAGEIVWVVGSRVDHRYRITDRTQKVYELRWHPAKF
uniref:tRNA(Ile)-lysidine synthase n=1 Tax=Roseihalotalea indica TaxID=2867963 RepID=A0AA49JGT7_9BACT|nr:tRNA lysidine(34) synthetase TilS [Tunicatimonas sp. TK19036]